VVKECELEYQNQSANDPMRDHLSPTPDSPFEIVKSRNEGSPTGGKFVGSSVK
jgi:hypothetical protein